MNPMVIFFAVFTALLLGMVIADFAAGEKGGK